jgi:glutamate-1-semialdehyde 2,1-aminomutase
VVGGKKEMMDLFVDPVASRRVLLAGTYNAHPIPTVAAIATIERLLMNNGEVYRHVETLGDMLESGIENIVGKLGITAVVARQSSALCVYFMDHLPKDWHDLAMHHDFDYDAEFRRILIDRGIYVFPLATKQCSLSAAHSKADVEETLLQMEHAFTLAVEANHGSFSSSSGRK